FRTAEEMALMAVSMAVSSWVSSPVAPFACRPVSMMNRVRVQTSVSKADWSDMLGSGPVLGSDPALGSGPALSSGPVVGSGPALGSDPMVGSGQVLCSDPALGSGPALSSGPVVGSGPALGSDPMVGSGQVLCSDPALGSGPVLGSDPAVFLADSRSGRSPGRTGLSFYLHASFYPLLFISEINLYVMFGFCCFYPFIV
uniref:Uncharacterized protein n=1 Tax=Poecilia mexicana TaxID=48701 RepID=A0A3B3Y3T8_9TELE